MNDQIDYEALERAYHEAEDASIYDQPGFVLHIARAKAVGWRAVVAEYQQQRRAQGVVEVRTDDLARAADWFEAHCEAGCPPADEETHGRIAAIVATITAEP